MSSTARRLLLLAALGLGAACAPVGGQVEGGVSGPSKGNLYERLGGADSLRGVVDQWMVLAASDPRIYDHFVDADIAALKLRMVEQLCLLSDGPCLYRGRDLAEVHREMELTDGDFEAFVADLDQALTDRGLEGPAADELLVRVRRLGRDLAASDAP